MASNRAGRRLLAVAMITAALSGSLVSPVSGVANAPLSAASGVGAVDDFGPFVDAYGGRAGADLSTVWVSASVNSSSVEALVGQPIVLQQWVSGTWSDRATIPLSLEEENRFALPEPASVTVRVTVPSAGLVSPEMALPATPALGRSRYYVRAWSKGSGRRILRVYEDGTVYGIRYGGQEYSCDTGTLAEGRLTLTTFDFGGGTETLRASRTWRNLRIHEKGSKAVKGARKSLSGKYRKNLKLCADLTYTSVTTNPDPLS